MSHFWRMDSLVPGNRTQWELLDRLNRMIPGKWVCAFRRVVLMNRGYSTCCTTVVCEIGCREYRKGNAFSTNSLRLRNSSSVTIIDAVESRASRNKAQNAQNRPQQQGLESKGHIRRSNTSINASLTLDL